MNNHVEKERLFEMQNQAIKAIINNGFTDFFNSLPETEKAFQISKKSVRCIDEGTVDGLHSAGSGILCSKNTALKVFREAGVTEITSHDNCGAAKLFAIQQGWPIEMSDEYGQKWAKEIATELNVPHKHISAKDMQRPANLHIARAIFYDNSGKFNNAINGLPSGFVISRKIQGAEASLAETEIAISIALGNHGFGELFTVENPLIIIGIGETMQDLKPILNELQKFKEEYGDRILIDSLPRK